MSEPLKLPHSLPAAPTSACDAPQGGRSDIAHSPATLAQIERTAPFRHRPWQKGQSGNPKGRPRKIKDSYEKRLNESTVYNGKKMKVADAIAHSMTDAAMRSALPHSVSAAREIRQTVDPEPTAEGGQINVANFNMKLLQIISQAKLERAT